MSRNDNSSDNQNVPADEQDVRDNHYYEDGVNATGDKGTSPDEQDQKDAAEAEKNRRSE